MIKDQNKIIYYITDIKEIMLYQRKLGIDSFQAIMIIISTHQG